MSSNSNGVLVERRDAVAIVTLDRPGRLNALSYDVIRALHATLDDLAADPTCRVLVLTGSGGAFCSGIDLKEQETRASWDPSLGRVQSHYALQQAVGDLVAKLRTTHQPVIAVVCGVAAGAGLSLACAADIRIAEPGARFAASFVRIGASGGDMGSSYFLPRIVGWDHAADLLYTGRIVECDEAFAMRLVTRVVEEGEGLSSALVIADAMVANAPFAARMTKSLLNVSMNGASLAEMLELENRTQILVSQTEDFAEGVRSFTERRSPEYRDR